MEKRYQVFVSSTYTDLKDERKSIIETLLNAKYIPAGMEMFSASNDEQFKYIKKIIDNCDYYVLIVGARYGTINPTTGISFTEQEYDYAVSKDIPVLAFLHDDPKSIPFEKQEVENIALLESFKTKVLDGRLCKPWHDKTTLASSVLISLTEEISENPQMGWTRGSSYDSSELLAQINELRIENERKDKELEILRERVKENEGETKNLAFGEDKFNIIGKESRYNESYTKKLKWDDIFSAVGPYLIAAKNYNAFADNLKSSINNIIGDPTFRTINDNCIQTIKIQFEALGLIDVEPAKSTGAGILEFIELTKKGRTYLSQIKSIKKEVKNQ